MNSDESEQHRNRGSTSPKYPEFPIVLTVNDGFSNSISDTVFITVLDETNSVYIISDNDAFRVYPNPASDYATIEVDKRLVGEKISISTSTGQLLSTYKLLNQTNKVDITSFKCGFYTISIQGKSISLLKVEN